MGWRMKENFTYKYIYFIIPIIPSTVAYNSGSDHLYEKYINNDTYIPIEICRSV